MNFTVKSSAIDWVPYSYASSKRGYKVYAGHIQLSKCDVLNQVIKCIKDKNLPTTLTVTGKKKMDLKIECYQDDGFWFRQLKPKDGKVWRIWLPTKDLLTMTSKNVS